MSAIVALVSLLLAVASLPVPGGVIFAPFLFGLFLLSLAGVVGRVGHRSVRQRHPVLDARRWRDGS
jgi:hypothetical protein